MQHPLDPQVPQFIIATIIALLVLRYYAKNKSFVADKYHTFWPRFLGPQIDRMVLWIPLSLVPYLIAQHYGFDESAIQTTFIVITLLYFVYSICFHALFGGTLGKLGTKLRVLRAKDETPISWGHAILRDIIPLALAVVLSVVAIQAYHDAPTLETNHDILAMTEEGHSSIPHHDQLVMNEGRAPSIHPANQALIYMSLILLGWYLLELITMFTNSKRRALHDFIAGTVVVRINLKDPTPGPVTFSDGGRLESSNSSPIQAPAKNP